MLTWGFIGASTIAAEWMIEAVRANGHEVASLASGSAAHGAAFAKQHGIPHATTNIEETINAADAIYISSTNEKHAAQAMMAINAGKHVLCEKPLAMSVAEAADMVRAAERAGIIFATNHHLRCSGSHRAVKQLIEDGRVGAVHSVRIHHVFYLPAHLQGWRIDSVAAGGGVISDITVHDADVVRFLLGAAPQSVIAATGGTGMGQGVEDSAMSVWQMASGAMVFAHESFNHPHATNGLEVHGAEGSIIARNVMTQKAVGEIELITQSGTETVPFSDHSLYAESVRRFTEAVHGNGAPAATGWDGVASLYIAECVREAAKAHARVRVDSGVFTPANAS